MSSKGERYCIKIKHMSDPVSLNKKKTIDSHEAKFGFLLNWVAEDRNIVHFRDEYQSAVSQLA